MKQLSRDIPAPGVSGEPIAGDSRAHRRLEITVEREVISVLSSNAPASSFPAFCAHCNREVTMLSPEAAAVAVGTTARTVYRWVEEKRLHFMELGSGKLFICSESLRALERANQISSGESR